MIFKAISGGYDERCYPRKMILCWSKRLVKLGHRVSHLRVSKISGKTPIVRNLEKYGTHATIVVQQPISNANIKMPRNHQTQNRMMVAVFGA